MPETVVTTRVFSFEDMCRRADDQIDQERLKPVQYEFGHRKFVAPVPMYGTATS